MFDYTEFRKWCESRGLAFTGLAPEDFMLRVYVFMEEQKAKADESARREVEGSLYEAGVIEDPDVDGGILG